MCINSHDSPQLSPSSPHPPHTRRTRPSFQALDRFGTAARRNRREAAGVEVDEGPLHGPRPRKIGGRHHQNN